MIKDDMSTSVNAADAMFGIIAAFVISCLVQSGNILFSILYSAKTTNTSNMISMMMNINPVSIPIISDIR